MESKESSIVTFSNETAAQPQDYNLFDDPVLKRVYVEFNADQREAYEKMGEKMYNFDYGSGEKNLDKLLVESCNRVCHMVRHGLHPSLMDKADINIVKEVVGKEWYTRFGYVKEDLDNIVTIPLDLPIPDYR